MLTIYPGTTPFWIGMDLVNRAATMALKAHDGQTRIGGAPYSTHPADVVLLLQWHGVTDPAILAAGWLHDVVEDTAISLPTIYAAFGPRVSELVALLTKTPDLLPQDYYHGIWAHPDATAIKLADRISNVRSIHLKGTDAALAYLEQTRLYFQGVQHPSGLADSLFDAFARAAADIPTPDATAPS